MGETVFPSALAKAPANLEILLAVPLLMELGDWAPDTALIEESRRLADCCAVLVEKLSIHFAGAGKWGVEPTFDDVYFFEAGHRAFETGMMGVLGQISPNTPAAAWKNT